MYPQQADFGSERGVVGGEGEQLALLGAERWGVRVGSEYVGDGGWTWLGAGGVPTGAVGCRRRRGRDGGVGGSQRGGLHGAQAVLLWSGTRRQVGGTQTINTRRRGRGGHGYGASGVEATGWPVVLRDGSQLGSRVVLQVTVHQRSTLMAGTTGGRDR